jgi:hypothetical protein
MDDLRTTLLIGGVGLISGSGVILAWALPPLTWVRLGQTMRRMARTVGLLVGAALATPPAAAAALGMLPPLLGGGLALLALLFFGFYLPGGEARAAQARARALRRQTPELLETLALHLDDATLGDVAILRLYLARPRASSAEMQRVIAAALDAHARQGRGSVWACLREETAPYGVADLTEAITLLERGADHDRRQAAPALRLIAERMTAAALDEWRARMQRREWALLGVTAGALFLGMLPFILYVLTDGLQVLTALAPTEVDTGGTPWMP